MNNSKKITSILKEIRHLGARLGWRFKVEIEKSNFDIQPAMSLKL